MMTIADRPNSIPWPPMILVAAFAAASALTLLMPLPWAPSPLSDILSAIGALLVLGALAIDVSAMNAMRRAKTAILPTRPAAHLLTKGIFALSRNPIYLANAMILLGVGLAVGSLWFFAGVVVQVLLTTQLAIRREERHLEARFGKSYRDYVKRVRRWI